MVNRNDATVPLVMIGGRTVWRDGAATELLGTERTGVFLRAGEQARRTAGDLSTAGGLEPFRASSGHSPLASPGGRWFGPRRSGHSHRSPVPRATP